MPFASLLANRKLEFLFEISRGGPLRAGQSDAQGPAQVREGALDVPTKGRAEALQIGCYKGGRRCAEKQSEAGQLRRQFPPGSRIRQKCFLDFRRASDQQIVHIVDSRLPKDPRGFRWYAKSFK